MKKIAIVGGGPCSVFVLKQFVEAKASDISITIYEKKKDVGPGMPYSSEGAGEEHITNVSGNEIPEMIIPLAEWVKSLPPETLKRYNINANDFNEYKVMPRLLFGQYLSAQFRILAKQAKQADIQLDIQRENLVTDLIDNPGEENVKIISEKNEPASFDRAIICTGHHWPKIYEGSVKGYFDSPYPPSKLTMKINHPVAIRGSSLTAVDAVRTLAKHNGEFLPNNDGTISFRLSDASNGFKIVLHSREGMLPAVRFHLEDSHLGKGSILTKEEIETNRSENEGFVSLDYVFEKNFKEPLSENDPEFYSRIKEMNLEQFVNFVMEVREDVDAFDLLYGEYIEAEKSIKRKESVSWKEMLGVLSFVMNYPAKYFSAEDMLRLVNKLHPLISIIIAYVPQSSVEEMLALHRAGLLEIVPVGEDSFVEPGNEAGAVYHYTDSTKQSQSNHYQVYINAVGQPHLAGDELPFKSLLKNNTIAPAKIKFRDPRNAELEKENGNTNAIIDQNGCYLNVPGIAINDYFQVLNEFGEANERIFMMAVPYIAGYNPDYSGLDFCEAGSKLVVSHIFNQRD